MGGLLPGVGALFMAWARSSRWRSGATSGAILAYGIGSVALGAVVAVLLHRLRRLGVLPPPPPFDLR